jgi:hypothetical protein
MQFSTPKSATKQSANEASMTGQSTTIQPTPTSHLRLGMARTDITPPVGIYHRMWGAARHDRATGVHRPLYADILLFAPLEEGDGTPWVQVELDMVGLGLQSHQEMRQAVAEELNLDASHVILSFSHTHSGGVFGLERVNMPGGDLIQPHLETVRAKLRSAAAAALADLSECYLTYGTGRCNMATNRDYWDDANNLFACGYNPDAPADDTLLVVRVTTPDATLRAIIVNYACHPTTLAWENTLISPDYVGALRATVEEATQCPCIFVQGACGELGPRRNYVKDTAIADANGRQVAYAALSVLQSMNPPTQDFVYAGPVISGATLGTWHNQPQTKQHIAAAERFAGRSHTVNLPQRARPSRAELEQALQGFLDQQADADRKGETVAARDLGARAERVRRAIGRMHNLPPGETYAYTYTVRRFGDAFWIGVGGEPYNALQTDVRAAFPDHPVIIAVLAGESAISYMLKADRYGKGLYQEEPSVLAPGCLEQVTASVIQTMQELV